MYSHAPPGYRCPFCLLIQAEHDPALLTAAADIVYQNGDVTAFIGFRQWPGNPGNTIIIPNRHFENIYELPVENAAKVHGLAKAVALAMKQAYQCDGVSLRQHNEPAGNQDVWHYHVHVTPRYQGDHFYTTYLSAGKMMPAADRARLAETLRKPVLLFMETDYMLKSDS